MNSLSKIGASAPLLAACLLALFGAPAAHAQSIAIQPVLVTIPAGANSAVMTIMNRSANADAFQIRGFQWEQTPEQVISLKPSADIIASPPIGTLEPGQTQTVRILITKPPMDREASYRILVDEIPPPSAPGTVRVAIRLSVPVFVAPPVRALPDLHWSLRRAGGNLILTAHNTGNSHASIISLDLDQGGKDIVVGAHQLPYILPGATRSWTVPYTGAASSFKLIASTAAGTTRGIIGVAG